MSRFSSIPSCDSTLNVNQNYNHSYWPQNFIKPVVGIDLHGTIINFVDDLNNLNQVTFINNSLLSIKTIRIKGYRVVIFADFPGIYKGTQTVETANQIFNFLLENLGQLGCKSIDGFYFNQSDVRNDLYAKPNLGMFLKAKKELKLDWEKGYFVGDGLDDLKIAYKLNCTPVLVKTGKGNDTLTLINKFTYKKLKNKTKIFFNLEQFANFLP